MYTLPRFVRHLVTVSGVMAATTAFSMTLVSRVEATHPQAFTEASADAVVAGADLDYRGRAYDPITLHQMRQAAHTQAKGHDCVEAQDWNSDTWPAGAIQMPAKANVKISAEWVPMDQAWSRASAGRAITLLLCRQ